MSKLLSCAVAGGLLLVCSVGAFAADSYYGMESGNSAVGSGNSAARSSNLRRPAAPPVQSQEANSNARRFYSYQPPVRRGQRAPLQTFIRPASAKALGNY
jgi:hypothetical protein